MKPIRIRFTAIIFTDFPQTFHSTARIKTAPAMKTCLVNNQIEIYFDYASKQLLSKYNSQGNNLIVDLDNPEHFADLWSGFTTEKLL